MAVYPFCTSCVTANISMLKVCMLEVHVCGLVRLLRVTLLAGGFLSFCLSYFEACCGVGCCLHQQQSDW